MYPVRDNNTRAKLAFAGLLLLAIVKLALLANQAWQYFLLLAAVPDISLLEVTDTITNIINRTHQVIYFSNVVLFIMWFRRAYWNLHAVDPTLPRFAEGWAAGGWFVPFLNLVRPYQIMREIWTGNQQFTTGKINTALPRALPGLWWTFFITGNVLISASIQYNKVARTIAHYKIYIMINTIANLAAIAALVMAMMLIRKINLMERKVEELSRLPSDDIFSPFYQPPAEPETATALDAAGE